MDHFNIGMENPIINDRGINLFLKKLSENLTLELVQGLDDFISDRNRINYSPITKTVIKYFGGEIKGNTKIRKKLFSEKILTPTLKDAAILNGVDIKSKKNILEQLNLKKEFEFAKPILTGSRFTSFIGNLSATDYWLEYLRQHPLPIHYNKLQLKLDAIICRELTGLTYDPDEIELGGFYINCKGQHRIIPKRSIGTFDDDHMTEIYNPKKTLAEFPINNSWSFPQISYACITLAERDCGGFADFLFDLYQQIKIYLDYVLGQIGLSIGELVAGIVGSVVGLVVGLLVGVLLVVIVRVLIDAFKDEIFEPQSVSISILSDITNFNGQTTTGPKILRFNDFRGKYEAWLSWELVS